MSEPPSEHQPMQDAVPALPIEDQAGAGEPESSSPEPLEGTSGEAEGVDEGPELVVGLVTPIGTATSDLASNLAGWLDNYNYVSVVIKLSKYLQAPGKTDPVGESEYRRVRRLIEAGNEFCRSHRSEKHPDGDPAAIAKLAISRIMKSRLELHRQDGDERSPQELLRTPRQRTAYILHSLKRPEEVRLLRKIYKDRFILVASQGTLQERRANLLSRALGRHELDKNKGEIVDGLIDLDAREDVACGQQVNKTYPLADYFMRDTDSERLIRLLFGEPLPPEIGEFAMYLAHASRSRSLAASRKVGAAIVKDESVISTGYNDAPFGHEPDVVAGVDTSERLKRANVVDTLTRLKAAGLLGEEAAMPVEDMVDQAMTALEGGDLLGVIEYQRAVHAEANAIDDASVRGISPAGGTLYVTTYPCHLCYKQSLSVRLKRIEYIEPYPKSRATAMYPDSDDGESRLVPYAGVAPLRYGRIFDERKPFAADATGTFPKVDGRVALPLVARKSDDADVLHQERLAVNDLHEEYQ